MQPPPAPPPLSPELAAAKVRERRQGAVVAVLGLAGVVGALGTMVYRDVTHAGPQQFANLAFLGSMVVYGLGLHRFLWAPRQDPGGIPRHIRPWGSVLLTLVTWWTLAQIAGLTSGALKPR
jgi:hypothetical protein